MDLVQWVEEAESLLRRDGLWPAEDDVRARGVLEEAALQGPVPLVQAIQALRRELRQRDAHGPNREPTPRWAASDRP